MEEESTISLDLSSCNRAVDKPLVKISTSWLLVEMNLIRTSPLITFSLTKCVTPPFWDIRGNANLSAKNKHFKWKRAFTTYKFKPPTLFYLSINNSLQNLEFSKRNILYKIKIWSVRNNLLLFASSMPIPRNDIILLGHLERVEGKMGEFDNSVRKIQHQGNKTCYKPLCHNL
jgi:hypothetical protein